MGGEMAGGETTSKYFFCKGKQNKTKKMGWMLANRGLDTGEMWD